MRPSGVVFRKGRVLLHRELKIYLLDGYLIIDSTKCKHLTLYKSPLIPIVENGINNLIDSKYFSFNKPIAPKSFFTF